MTTGNIRAYLRGDANVMCDVCDRKRKWHEVTMAYGTGDLAVIVSCLDGCADYRHPLNSPPPLIFDGQPVKNARPPATGPDVSPTFFPSGFTWGNFPGGNWGNFNNGNSVFSTGIPWTWGNFRKNQ